MSHRGAGTEPGPGGRWPGPCESDPLQRGLETFEVFVEGTRSRDRRFLAPKTGLIRALQVRPILFLVFPVSGKSLLLSVCCADCVVFWRAGLPLLLAFVGTYSKGCGCGGVAKQMTDVDELFEADDCFCVLFSVVRISRTLFGSSDGRLVLGLSWGASEARS